MRWIAFLTGVLLAMGLASATTAGAFQPVAADSSAVVSQSVLLRSGTAAVNMLPAGSVTLPLGAGQGAELRPLLHLLMGMALIAVVVGWLVWNRHLQRRLQAQPWRQQRARLAR